MKRIFEKKNILAILGAILCMISAHATLPSFDAGDENENQDSISRFGKKPNFESRAPLAKVVAPIEMSSFEATSASRAPASEGSRAPAADSVVAKEVATGATEKTVVNHLKKMKATQEVALIANDLGFFPSTLFVTQGIPVRLFITGASKTSQCFIFETKEVRRQIQNQKIEEVNFTLDEPGTYTFNCPINGAQGTVVVRELDFVARMPASEPSEKSRMAKRNDDLEETVSSQAELLDDEKEGTFFKNEH